MTKLICRVDPKTGEVKVLINEISKPYFNNDIFSLSLLNGGKDTIWWSGRTGSGYFYHYDGEGNLKNAITYGSWTAGKIVKIDTVGRTIYFKGYGQQKGLVLISHGSIKLRLTGMVRLIY